MGPNPEGPIDPIVPALKVETQSGELLAVLFGCACHNTTLTGAHNLISGDYAGYAQKYLAEEYPETEFLFMSGCGADANPEPRGTLPQAKDHGRELANEVKRIVEGDMIQLEGPLQTDYRLVDLPILSLSREEIEEYANIPSSQALMAKQMLAVLERGQSLPETYAAPFGLWNFGKGLNLIALPAEPVAEYSLKIRDLLGSSTTWVAGYNNDCFGYLPNAQIVDEGGHEAIGITLWIWGKHLFDQVGFFAPEVEGTVMSAISDLHNDQE